ncbi:hypothetical protein N7523_000604 [Penicillium sp. IBT 18751x]|nr:hypothetical protein N7523_000604 [Penicillium sp. IBT 18751x]
MFHSLGLQHCYTHCFILANRVIRTVWEVVPDPRAARDSFKEGSDRSTTDANVKWTPANHYSAPDPLEHVPTGMDTAKRRVNKAHNEGPAPRSDEPILINGMTADIFSKPP